MQISYAELHCASNFSFLRGASHPEELVERAIALGYSALAITDECSFAGSARAHLALRDAVERYPAARDFRLIHGTEIRLEDGPTLVLLATSRAGYGNLSQLVTLARRQASKGSYRLTRADLDRHRHWLADTLALLKPKLGSESNFFPGVPAGGKFDSDPNFLELWPGRCWIACELNRG
ncbi:MAG: PHP domain-containing protein, partial [Burkholderiales bacterium]